jgi:hypothetical protein
LRGSPPATRGQDRGKPRAPRPNVRSCGAQAKPGGSGVAQRDSHRTVSRSCSPRQAHQPPAVILEMHMTVDSCLRDWTSEVCCDLSGRQGIGCSAVRDLCRHRAPRARAHMPRPRRGASARARPLDLIALRQ